MEWNSMSQQGVFCQENDRWIYIEKINGKIIGINYCQGDDFKYFRSDFYKPNEELTLFFNILKNFKEYENEISMINEIIELKFTLDNHEYIF